MEEQVIVDDQAEPLGTAEQLGAGADLSLAAPPQIRFVPDGVVRAAGSGADMLRGTLLIMPGCSRDEVDWPLRISRHLRRLRLWMSADPDTGGRSPVHGHVLKTDPSPDNLGKANQLWSALIVDPWTQLPAFSHAVIGAAQQDPAWAPRVGALLARRRSLGSAGARVEQPDNNRNRRLAGDGPEALGLPNKACYVTSPPSSELEREFASLDGLRYLLALTPVETKQDRRTGCSRKIHAPFAMESLFGTVELFQGMRPGGKARADEDKHIDSVDPNFWDACTAVAGRGLVVALDVAQTVNTKLKAWDPRASAGVPRSVGPFHRVAADPGPDPLPGAGLRAAILEVRKSQIDDAKRDYQSHGSFAARIGRLGDQSGVEAAIFTAVTGDDLQPSAPGLLLDLARTGALRDRLQTFEKSMQAKQPRFQQLIAAHLLSIRPDAALDGRDLAVHFDGEIRMLSPAEVDRELKLVDTADDRRHFGLLGFPAVARVVRLIVDVEIPLGEVASAFAPTSSAAGSSIRFFVTADVGAQGDVPYWTACELSRRTHGRRWLFTPFDSDDPADPAPDHLQGTLNLNQRAGSTPRYTLSSMDIASRAEQLIHKAESTVSADSSGADRDPGEIRASSPGIVLRDLGRAPAIQGEVRKNDDLQAKGTAKLFARDLVTGYRVDVAIAARRDVQDDGSGGGQDEPSDWTWRSLTRRLVRFAPVTRRGGPGRPTPIDVEQLVSDTLQAVVANTTDDAQQLRDRLDEASMRPASRVITTRPSRTGSANQPPPEEIMAIDTLMQWEGDPLGTSCTAGFDWPDESGSQQSSSAGLDLPLVFTVDLPRARPLNPPRLEFGREYRFGLRSTYPGGGGVSLEDAISAYENDTLAAALPRRTQRAQRFRHLRQERIAAPVVSLIDPAPRDRPGDTLANLIVRTGESRDSGTAISRRIVYVPGLPMDAAAAHPHPHDQQARALDLGSAYMIGGRPMGGLLNVKLDPVTGGLAIRFGDRLTYASALPDRPLPSPATGPDKDLHPEPGRLRAKGVFAIQDTEYRDIEARRAHYYPDPCVRSLAFQLYTRGADPVAVAEPTIVEIYDRDYRQHDSTRLALSARRRTCEFPFAMPVLIELERGAAGDGPKLRHGAATDTGFLDSDGKFTRLRPREGPPEGSVTVRRLHVRLAAADDLDLRCWCLTSPDRLHLFGNFEQARRLAKASASALRNVAEPRLLAGPVPEQADVLSLQVTHAVQRPIPPEIPRGGLRLLRRTIAQERWPEAATTIYSDADQWDAHHEVGADMTWIGGLIEADCNTAASLALHISYDDVRDEPGKPLPYENSALHFPRKGPVVLPVRLQPEPLADPGREAVDLVREGLAAQPLVIQFGDSRAHRLEVVPVATSRFVRAFTDQQPPLAAFTKQGVAVEKWVLATRRPDPISYVELLPVFVWESRVRGANWVKRRMAARVMWRRPRLAGAAPEEGKEAVGCWFSSGEGERFALILPKSGDPATTLGPLEHYVTQWGADPIRETLDPAPWALPKEIFTRAAHATPADDVWVPAVGERDDGALTTDTRFARPLDLVTYMPQYDPEEDLWYVDIDIDPGPDPRDPDKDLVLPGAGPWMRFGMIRYQEHAMECRTDPTVDLRSSRPSKIEFRLEPARRVDVSVGRKVDGLWPITIRVTGPLATIKGGAEGLPEPLKSEYEAITRPRFTATLLREPRALIDSFGEGGAEIVAVVSSDDLPPPQGDLLCELTMRVRRDPRRAPHRIFLTEVDRMLSAGGDALVESGPRFMANIKIRPDR